MGTQTRWIKTLAYPNAEQSVRISNKVRSNEGRRAPRFTDVTDRNNPDGIHSLCRRVCSDDGSLAHHKYHTAVARSSKFRRRQKWWRPRSTARCALKIARESSSSRDPSLVRPRDASKTQRRIFSRFFHCQQASPLPEFGKREFQPLAAFAASVKAGMISKRSPTIP